ncbi:unnamed protein product [Timema podura]|uniref:Uncharacterized protein n=1 Tax=Timema podura TaxID=61482 RepID=A0ABN7NGR6_TIMPD|nr:unnamed protein product [Timema podura]
MGPQVSYTDRAATDISDDSANICEYRMSRAQYKEPSCKFGWFHLLVLFVCGSTFLSVTLVPNVLTYMSDDVGCDLGLSLRDKSTTNDLTYTGRESMHDGGPIPFTPASRVTLSLDESESMMRQINFFSPAESIHGVRRGIAQHEHLLTAA